MKTLFGLLSAISILSAEPVEKTADQKFNERFLGVQIAYHKDIVIEYLKADKVTIHLVDSGFWSEKDVTKREEFVPLLLNGSFSKILKSKTLDEKDRGEFLKIFSTQLAKEDNFPGLLCHYPFHAIRIYSKDKMIFEGTFCWECQNFAFRYPTGDAYLATSQDLRDFMKRALPQPEQAEPAVKPVK